jgi:hypothetical protein
MLRKYSLSMMVLLVAASLIGISSIHQYVEGQAPPAKVPQQKQAQEEVQVAGRVVAAIISASKTCIAFVELPGDKPNLLRLKPGTTITLFAPIESCALFGLSKIGNTQIQFVTQIAPSSTERQYRVTQVIL